MFEISGSRGTLIVSSEGSSQIGELALGGVQHGDPSFQAIPISENNLWVPNDVPEGPPLNVAQLFRQLGEHIRNGSPVIPDFTTAVTMHKVLDAIQRVSDTGQKQSL